MRLLVGVAMLVCAISGCAPASKGSVDRGTVRSVLEGRTAGFVLVASDSVEVLRVDEARCAERLPPCSTFKIWNTMVALQLGLVSTLEEPFYKWDGQKRSIAAWNQDLTLGRAFSVSCVPAFQAL